MRHADCLFPCLTATVLLSVSMAVLLDQMSASGDRDNAGRVQRAPASITKSHKRAIEAGQVQAREQNAKELEAAHEEQAEGQEQAELFAAGSFECNGTTPEAWSEAEVLWCCNKTNNNLNESTQSWCRAKHADGTGHSDFDCRADLLKWKEKWPAEKEGLVLRAPGHVLRVRPQHVRRRGHRPDHHGSTLGARALLGRSLS